MAPRLRMKFSEVWQKARGKESRATTYVGLEARQSEFENAAKLEPLNTNNTA